MKRMLDEGLLYFTSHEKHNENANFESLEWI